uniref:RING-type domain-containing protein n=1 Tax=Strongyloides venezuelensis TaxID=75913 RepID=A0A0K0FC05_STRVS
MMAIECIICLESCEPSGTRHAPYSTPCRHVIGMECLEQLKVVSNDDNLNCPFCNENIKFSGCRPIYGFVEEDSTEESRNFIKESKENIRFSKDFNKDINGNIKFFDEHKGYILIAGEGSSKFPGTQFIKLIVTKDNKIYNISKSIIKPKCSCLCFNKFNNDVIEFCIGYINGTIKLYRCKFDGNNLKIIGKKSINNRDLISHLRGKIEVNSTCFLNNGNVAFSIGKGKLRIWNKSNKCLSKTQIFTKFSYSEFDNITLLKSTKYGDCIGVMNNRIYVFQKSGTSYELASEIGKKIISYSFDEDFTRLLVLYSNEMDEKRKNSVSQSFVFYEIIEIDYTDNFDKKFKKHYAINLIINNSIQSKIPKSFITQLFAAEQSDGTFLYHCILPNMKDIKNCLGITFVDGEEFCMQRNSRNKIAKIFKNKVVVTDMV